MMLVVSHGEDDRNADEDALEWWAEDVFRRKI